MKGWSHKKITLSSSKAGENKPEQDLGEGEWRRAWGKAHRTPEAKDSEKPPPAPSGGLQGPAFAYLVLFSNHTGKQHL